MLAKDKGRLDALRAVKAALLLAGSEKGAGGAVSEEAGLKVLQKLVKQRKESAEIYVQQNRQDMAEEELAQSAVIEEYLPAQITPEQIEAVVKAIIAETGASSLADMGKVMGAASAKLAGKADGREISGIVKRLLATS